MEDQIITTNPVPQKPRKKKFRISKKNTKRLFKALAVVIVLMVVYSVGAQQGAQRQKKFDDKRIVASRTTVSAPKPNRWAILGTVLEVSEGSVDVRDSLNIEQTLIINEDTMFIDKTGAKTDAKALTKDSKIIASGLRDDEKGYIATRIRVN